MRVMKGWGRGGGRGEEGERRGRGFACMGVRSSRTVPKNRKPKCWTMLYVSGQLCSSVVKFLTLLDIGEIKQLLRLRKRKVHLKILFHFNCATSRLFQLTHLVQKRVNYSGTKLVDVTFE